MAQVINKDNFRSEIEKNNVSIVDFFATWCGPCKMLAPIFEGLSTEMDNVGFYKVDIDNDLDIAREFNITTVPTMIIFKDGKPVDTLVGFVPKDSIKSKIESHM